MKQDARRNEAPGWNRTNSFVTLVLLVSAALFFAGCPPHARLYSSAVQGHLSLYYADDPFATVYLADSASGKRIDRSLTYANANGRFHIAADAGNYSLVAIDASGFYASQPVVLVEGQATEADLELQPCAVSATDPNGLNDQACPAGAPASTPPPSYDAGLFVADSVSATVAPDAYGINAVDVYATDAVAGLAIDVHISSTSADFAAGTYSLTPDPANPFSGDVGAYLIYGDGSVVYGLLSGTLVVNHVDGIVGGTASLSLDAATFGWVDLNTGTTVDASKTITIAGTSVLSAPLTTGQVPGQGAGGPNATPTPLPAVSPAGPVALGTLPPVFAVSAGLDPYGGGVELRATWDLGAGAVLSIDRLALPYSVNVVGTHTLSSQSGVANTTGFFCAARYSNGSGVWPYYLDSATLDITDAGTLAGQTVTVRLTGATFFYVDPATGLATGSAVLTMDDSGTLSGVLTGGVPWNGIYPHLGGSASSF